MIDNMFLTSVLLSGLLAMQAAADLDKPQMQLPPPSLDGGLWGNLDPTRSNWHKWEWGCEGKQPYNSLFAGGGSSRMLTG
jgi:hypothetical protein